MGESLHGPEGLLVIHTSPLHSTLNTDSIDVYGASLAQQCSLLRNMNFHIVDVLRIPSESVKLHYDSDLIFAVRGPNSREPLGRVGYDSIDNAAAAGAGAFEVYKEEFITNRQSAREEKQGHMKERKMFSLVK